MNIRCGRFSAWAGLLVGLGLTTRAAAADGFSGFFTNAAPGHFIRKLEGGLARTESPGGCQISRREQWLPEHNLLIIESEIRNSSGTPVELASVPLLDLAFQVGSPAHDPRWQRLSYREEQWYGSSFWTGPDWTRVGRDWQHPGEATSSVRCFRCPRDGRLTVSGRVYKLHKDGDGVRVSIRHDNRELWKAEIEGQDGQGVEPHLTFDVKQGDALRFVVHKRGHIFCDTTYWNPTVSFAGGESYQAAEAFSHEQGKGHWFYEMLVENGPKAPDPVARLVGNDLSLREWTLTTGQGCDGSQRDALGFLTLSEGANGSGVVLAVDAANNWSVRAEMSPDGRLQVKLGTGSATAPRRVAPGETVKLPATALGIYNGPWAASLSLLKPLAGDTGQAGRFPALAQALGTAHRQATATLEKAPDVGLLLTAQNEWRRDDRVRETGESYQAAITNQLHRTRRLLADVQTGQPRGFLGKQAVRLGQLTEQAGRPSQVLDDWRTLYLQTRLLKRDITLQNPLLHFDRLLFSKRVPPSYSHHVGQYFGWRQRPGGGVFVLEQPGCSLATRELAGAQLPPGSFLEPSLSYDARRVVFSFVACTNPTPDSTVLPVNETGPDERYFHIFEVNADGTGLRQLTRGPYDDMMPAFLPDGGIVFTSTRRRGYSRCFGPNFSRRWHSYTLHRMDPDGGNLQILSLNDVNEWFPSVSQDGLILFARWDYIDRDAVTHQNLWAMRPDGSNPTAVWGNATPKPHCTFQAKPIPGSRKLAFIASAHHSITAGPVCLLDPAVDPNSLDAITRVTPGPLPEAESERIDEYYESAWPLSESYFLVAYSPERLRFEGEHMQNPNPDNALGLYLLDAAGNRELLYRDPRLSSTCPTPLAPRPRPPILPTALAQARSSLGEMILTDIGQGLGTLPRGHIKRLRVIQILPKSTWLADQPIVGAAGEENTRAILGTVPVEPDGSARFLVPARKPLLFQALDENGFAYQTMRSSTYVQPGEQVSCIGCHEHPSTAPPRIPSVPLALRRPPSSLEPGPLDDRPFSFVEVVQPVLDQHCVRCHGGEKIEANFDLTAKPLKGFTKSYWALCTAREKAPGVAVAAANAPLLVPRFPSRNQIQRTPPGGQCGALGSGLIKLLRAGHGEVKLSDAELRRFATWIDCNAVFHGTYDSAEQSRQLAGKRLPMPAVQ